MAAVPLRRALIKVIEDKAEEKHNASLSNMAFDTPSWAHKQAYNNGYERALKDILSFL